MKAIQLCLANAAEDARLQLCRRAQQRLKLLRGAAHALCKNGDGLGSSAGLQLLHQKIAPAAQICVAGKRQPAGGLGSRQQCSHAGGQQRPVALIEIRAQHVVQKQAFAKILPARLRPEHRLKDLPQPQLIQCQVRQVAGNEGALCGRKAGRSELRMRLQQAKHGARRLGNRHVKEMRGAARCARERLHIWRGVAKEKGAVRSGRIQRNLQGRSHLQVIKRRGHGKSIGRQHPPSSTCTHQQSYNYSQFAFKFLPQFIGMPLQPGLHVHHRYRIDALLSPFEAGTVYAAYDTISNQTCVVKEFGTVDGAEFDTIAAALRQVVHPNLAGVLDHFTMGDTRYLVMEYVSGVSVADRVADEGPLAEAVAIELTMQILVAVHHLHERPVPLFHRDIKAANILLTSEDQAVLVDYSIGKTHRPGTPATLVAPEQLTGQVTAASEVYALGSVLYFMLTGTIPGDSQNGIPDRFAIRQLRTFEQPPGKELTRIVEKAMAFRVEDRYESVREMRKALGKVVPHVTPLHIPVDPPPPADTPFPPGELEEPPPTAAGSRLRNLQRLAKLFMRESIVIGGVIVAVLVAMIVFQQVNGSLRFEPVAPTQVLVIVAQTATPANGIAMVAATETATATPSPTALPTATAVPPTPTPTSTPTITPTLPPTLGSSAISAIDGATLMFVPGGSFIMGSDFGDRTSQLDEQPLNTVTLPDFWVDRTEVTVGQYQKCIAANACTPPEKTSSGTRAKYFDDEKYAAYPVLWLNWAQSANYCEWAGRRLPTDMEWEKAARGPDGNKYPWGVAPPDSTRANFASQSRDTTAVGTYPLGASPYGALDMSGNVAERVSSFYRSHWFNLDKVLTATPPPEESFRGGAYGLRNGSWTDSASKQRAAYHGFAIDNQVGTHNIGFRCVVSQLP